MMRTDFAWLGVCIISLSLAHATSLYRSDSYQALASDTRSFRVGDALTVMIVEASSAQSQAASNFDRNTTVSAQAQDSIASNKLGVGLEHQTKGTGTTTRNGQLRAQISVRVQDVATNGDLVVHGTQKITVNGETQRISVSGTVRPIDVSADNIVLSTRLTNAEIEYAGKGFVDRNQEEGWWSRLLGLLGL